ncbi:MAG: hypothetical protein IPJ30_26790 [Acidobacteria bacterium]|nr:hypothetical protein [Acidobacteriota bacterium]
MKRFDGSKRSINRHRANSASNSRQRPKPPAANDRDSRFQIPDSRILDSRIPDSRIPDSRIGNFEKPHLFEVGFGWSIG